MGVEVICINDKNMPSDFPSGHWIKEGEIYHVVEAMKMARQKGVYGFVLEEIKLPEDSKYDSFDSRRFALVIRENDLADEIERSLNEDIGSGKIKELEEEQILN